jgi:hypothetical protein
MKSIGLISSIVVAAVVIPVSTGCETGSATGASHDASLHQWRERVGSSGLVGIIPPEEDLRVGDIFAFSISPDQLESGSSTARQAAARRVAASSRWASLPVLTDLEDEYGQRPPWPRTPDAFAGKPGALGQWQEADSGGSSIFRAGQVTTRLRLVGLDQFTAVSFTGNDLESMIPTEAATLIAGAADPRTLAVTFRAGAAESYSLSLDSLIGLLLDDTTGDGGGGGYVLKPQYRRNLDLLADPTSNRVWLQVISEVVYIRSADFTIRTLNAVPSSEQITAEELAKVAGAAQASAASSASSAAPSEPAQPVAATAQPTDATAQPAEVAAQPVEATAQPAETDSSDRALGAYAATKLDPLYGAFVRAQAINEVLAESNGDDVPGSLVNFISVTDESVALRRIWPRGLAIGVRGLILEIDAATGRVLRSGPMGQPLPRRAATAAP